jgi:hypothetical protein
MGICNKEDNQIQTLAISKNGAKSLKGDFRDNLVITKSVYVWIMD